MPRKWVLRKRYRIANVIVRKLFQLVSKLTDATKQKSLTEYSDPTEFANDFANFFINKIKKVRDTLHHHPTYKPTEATVLLKFAQFKEISENEVLTIIKKMPAKSVNWMYGRHLWWKEHFLRWSEPSLNLMTCLLQRGVFVSQWKIAPLKSLLKKIGLDIIEKSNYRPVSNLSFLSHLVEKCVLIQINKCADNTLFLITRVHKEQTIPVKLHWLKWLMTYFGVWKGRRLLLSQPLTCPQLLTPLIMTSYWKSCR